MQGQLYQDADDGEVQGYVGIAEKRDLACSRDRLNQRHQTGVRNLQHLKLLCLRCLEREKPL